MTSLSIIGCGFVADLYMRSLALYPHVKVSAVYDHDAQRLKEFCDYWDLPVCGSQEELFAKTGEQSLVLNLTNPSSHYEVNKACLVAGLNVYSEKPLAVSMEHARELYHLAQDRGLMLASAPCSVLGQAAQGFAKALREGVIGTPRLIYAELDDGFVPQAPFADWKSESGAPWPAEDEFQVGCTLEHAGYYLSWLIACFGSVERVVAVSDEILPNKQPSGGGTPDFSTAVLFFKDGPTVRLTCSIVAPHDHQIRAIGDLGVLKLSKAWDNRASVRFHKRIKIRRRLLEHPIGRRVGIKGKPHPVPGRWGAANMNFALGPIEALDALREGRTSRLSNEFALHLNEVTLAIQNAGRDTCLQQMTTTCAPMEPMPWAR